MVSCGIFQTPEFYVIVSVIAAAVITIAALPDRKRAAVQHLVAGELLSSVDAPENVGPGHGRIEIEVHEGNFVSLRRYGLAGVTMSGAVSLAIEVAGFDIVIQERVTPGAASPFGMADVALFHLDFLAPEWYHIRYESEQYSEHTALTLHVRPGIKMTKPLIH